VKLTILTDKQTRDEIKIAKGFRINRFLRTRQRQRCMRVVVSLCGRRGLHATAPLSPRNFSQLDATQLQAVSVGGNYYDTSSANCWIILQKKLQNLAGKFFSCYEFFSKF
jgi:hypothetical protein